MRLESEYIINMKELSHQECKEIRGQNLFQYHFNDAQRDKQPSYPSLTPIDIIVIFKARMG